MSAKDVYHDAVKNALTRDGWQITHDPYTITVARKDVFIDLGAERPLAAEKEGREIAVEVKSFRGPSDLRDFELALGQYLFYRSLITRYDPGRELFLAVSEITYVNTFREPIVQPSLEDFKVPIIVFRPSEERIVRWISWKTTGEPSGA